jgi:hypothetical protein
VCKSAAEGGQRCASHAKKAMDTARTALRDKTAMRQATAQAVAATDDDTPLDVKFRREAYMAEARREEHKARSEYRSALADYASTPEGQQYVTDELAKPDNSLGRQGALTQAQREGAYRRDRSTLVASGMTYSDVNAMDRTSVAAAAKDAKPLRAPKGAKRVMAKDASGRDRHALLSETGEHWQEGGKTWQVSSLAGESIGTVDRYSEQEMHSYGGGSRLAWQGKPRTKWSASGTGFRTYRGSHATRDEALNELLDGHEQAAQQRTAAAAAS